MSGFDLADPERGVFASAHQGGVAIVFEQDEVIAAGPAASALAAGEVGERGSLALEGVSLDVGLTPLQDPMRLSGDLTGAAELTVCRATGSLRRDSGETEIACLAVGTRTVQEAAGEADLRRSVAIAFADGGLVALMAARPPGAEGHGEEEVVAGLTESEGEVPVAKALLSTHYDGEGRHRRANLELWHGGETPLRITGAIVCGAAVEAGDRRVETAFFRWSLDGRPGIGRYEIVRRG